MQYRFDNKVIKTLTVRRLSEIIDGLRIEAPRRRQNINCLINEVVDQIIAGHDPIATDFSESTRENPQSTS